MKEIAELIKRRKREQEWGKERVRKSKEEKKTEGRKIWVGEKKRTVKRKRRYMKKEGKNKLKIEKKERRKEKIYESKSVKLSIGIKFFFHCYLSIRILYL